MQAQKGNQSPELRQSISQTIFFLAQERSRTAMSSREAFEFNPELIEYVIETRVLQMDLENKGALRFNFPTHSSEL